jgi:hypothetical protein
MNIEHSNLNILSTLGFESLSSFYSAKKLAKLTLVCPLKETALILQIFLTFAYSWDTRR